MAVKAVSPRLVLYLTEGGGETAARQISLIIGSAHCRRLQDYDPAYQENYDYFVIGGGLVAGGAARLDDFISANRGWLVRKEVALFSLGDDDEAARAQLSELAAPLADSVLAIEPIPGGKNGVDITQLVAAALRIRAKFRERRKKMPAPEVRRLVEDILESEAYLILATGAEPNLRATTIGYHYRDGHVYAFCEGAEKFANILLNDRVALAFYRMPEKDGLQASGTATIVYPGTEAYRKMCDLLGRDHDRLMSLPFHLNGLDIKLHKVEYYRAKLREGGYDSKQVYYF